jgi:hypothetical protein
MGWGTITYINIYFVDTTKNCKEKRLKFRDIISKWVFREKIFGFMGGLTYIQMGLKIMIKVRE